MNAKQKLLIICGPTAIGKTRIACMLAKKFDAELVSADSRQVYTGLDIVTGKDLVSRETIKSRRLTVFYNRTKYVLVPYVFHGVPLWMYDVVSPDQAFSVAQYQSLTGTVIKDIQKRNKLPIVVGGTGLYIRSIIRPIETASIAPDPGLRKKLQTASLEEIQKKLKDINSKIFKNLNKSDRRNPRRLIRKIEICLSQKKLLNKQPPAGINTLFIGLTASLKNIYKRIDVRIDERMKSGAFDEVKKMQFLYGFNIPSMTGLGYKEWKEYFSDNQDIWSKEEIIRRWKYNEHAYGRRQMTWFRKEKSINWFTVENSDVDNAIESLVRKWYTQE